MIVPIPGLASEISWATNLIKNAGSSFEVVSLVAGSAGSRFVVRCTEIINGDANSISVEDPSGRAG